MSESVGIIASVSSPISVGVVVPPYQTINLITVSGPPGPPGANGFTSGFAGVSYLNGLSGAVNLLGGAGISIYPSGNDLVIAYTGAEGGSGVSQADLLALSGYLSNALTATGVALGAQINALSGYVTGLNLTNTGYATVGQLTATGATLYQRDADISGVLAAQIAAASAGVSSLNGQSGIVTLAGAGTVSVLGGLPGTIYISGDPSISGALTATGAALIQRDSDISGVLAAQIAQASGALTGAPGNDSYVIFNRAGAFGTDGNLSFEVGANRLNVGNRTSADNGIITVGGTAGIGTINGGGNDLRIDGKPLSLRVNLAEYLRFDSGAWLINNTPGASGQVLTSRGTGFLPLWATPTGDAYTLSLLAQTGSSLYQTITDASGALVNLINAPTAGGTLITSNYNIAANDNRIYCNNTNPITLTFNNAITASGQLVRVKLINTGTVYLTGALGQLFDGSPLYSMVGQYSAKEFHAFNGAWNLW